MNDDYSFHADPHLDIWGDTQWDHESVPQHDPSVRFWPWPEYNPYAVPPDCYECGNDPCTCITCDWCGQPIEGEAEEMFIGSKVRLFCSPKHADLYYIERNPDELPWSDEEIA